MEPTKKKMKLEANESIDSSGKYNEDFVIDVYLPDETAHDDVLESHPSV